MKGIDVSHHQGEIDWTAAAASGVRFAYIKATEGATVTDSRFVKNVIGAKEVGIPVGAYHLARPDLGAYIGRSPSVLGFNRDAAEESEYFLKGVVKLDLEPALDMETRHIDSTLEARILTADGLIGWMLDWARLVRPEAPPLLYMSFRGIRHLRQHGASDTALAKLAARFRLWLAQHNVNGSRLQVKHDSPWPRERIILWQWTSGEAPNWVESRGLDRNRFLGSPAQFKVWSGDLCKVKNWVVSGRAPVTMEVIARSEQEAVALASQSQSGAIWEGARPL